MTPAHQIHSNSNWPPTAGRYGSAGVGLMTTKQAVCSLLRASVSCNSPIAQQPFHACPPTSVAG